MVGLPCVWHAQDRVAERAWGLYPRLVAAAAERLADHVIADGPTIVEQQPERMREAGQVSLIYNGVDTETFSPAVAGGGVREEFGLGDDEIVIGNVARLTPWKGQHLLVEAFGQLAAEFRNTHLLLVGSAIFSGEDYERRLRQQVSELGLEERVTFAGYRWDLPEVLAAMDIFAYTAVEKDTSPLSLLSAMAAGKPIIAPSLSGVRELFRDGEDALLFPPKDVGQLYQALRSLLQDEELRRGLGRAARERALAEYSVEQYARRCEEVFLRVLRGYEPAGTRVLTKRQRGVEGKASS
jgi:glycosyltransferase involved in cell wall biosynthesis